MKLGPTMCRAKRCVRTFKAVEAVEASLVPAHTKTDQGLKVKFELVVGRRNC